MKIRQQLLKERKDTFLVCTKQHMHDVGDLKVEVGFRKCDAMCTHTVLENINNKQYIQTSYNKNTNTIQCGCQLVHFSWCLKQNHINFQLIQSIVLLVTLTQIKWNASPCKN